MKSPTQDAPSDLQDHLARLDARGLVTRIERPINKDTELHPLARWQFQGGLRDEERRAFLFTNVVGAGGEHYDIPVLVGGLAASPEIYAAGLGVPVDDIGRVWVKAMAGPLAPVLIESAPCQEIIMTGAERSEERRVGKECRSLCDWSSDVCSSDLPTWSAPVASTTTFQCWSADWRHLRRFTRPGSACRSTTSAAFGSRRWRGRSRRC